MSGRVPKPQQERDNTNLAAPLHDQNHTPLVHSKFEIGKPNDKHEVEAGDMADKVMAPYDRSSMVMMAPNPDNPTLRMMPTPDKKMVMMAGNPGNPTLRKMPQVQKNETVGHQDEEKDELIQPEMHQGKEASVQMKSEENKIQRQIPDKGEQSDRTINVTSSIKMIRVLGESDMQVIQAYTDLVGYDKNFFKFDVQGGALGQIPKKVEVTTIDQQVKTVFIPGFNLTTFHITVKNTGAKGDPPYDLIPATDQTSQKISEVIYEDFNRAVNKIKELTGKDLGVDFGNITRALSHGGGSGSDAVSWHKTGRAVDFEQGKFGDAVFEYDIRKIDGEKRTFWKIYMPYKDRTASITALSPGDRKYFKAFTADDIKANSYKTGKPQKTGGKYIPYIDFRAILHEYGFQEIPAHTTWKTSGVWNEQEWWHFERTDNLSWWEAIREVHSLEKIYKEFGPVVRKKRKTIGGRLVREGVPLNVISKFVKNSKIKSGSISLGYSVGDSRNAANIPEDVAEIAGAMSTLGYPRNGLTGSKFMLGFHISDLQDKLGYKQRKYISPNGDTHKKLGQLIPNKITKGSITLYDSVGTNMRNFSADVQSIQRALNDGYRQGKFKFMTGEIFEHGALTPITLSTIKQFQKEIMKMAKPNGQISKGGTTHTKLADALKK